MSDEIEDIHKKLLRDIELYQQTGQLPKERDVIYRHTSPDSSPYWEWVDRIREGREPLWNSGDQIVSDQQTELVTNYGEEFSGWLTDVYPGLSDEDKETFQLYWEKGVNQDNIATYLGVSQAEVSRRLNSMRQSIADYIGL